MPRTDGYGNNEDEDMSDIEEVSDFPEGHVPGFTPLASISDAFLDSLLLMIKGRGSRKGSTLVALEVGLLSLSRCASLTAGSIVR